MGDFFKSRRFKVLALLVIAMFFFMLRAAQDQASMPFLSRAAGVVLTPVQRVASAISHRIGRSFSDVLNASAIAGENEQLQQELATLRQALAEYERYRAENEQLREFLGIKQRHPDFEVEPAIVIGRDAAERFHSFTIDRGARDGVKPNDPVISSEGLVGIVSEVGPSHAKVLTILDAVIEVGVMDVSTREIGITPGAVDLAAEGRLRMSYLPRDSAAAPGDIVVTTGTGELFPRELLVGEIEEVLPDAQGLSRYAVIRPFCDVRDAHNVLVIKRFEGQSPSPDGGR